MTRHGCSGGTREILQKKKKNSTSKVFCPTCSKRTGLKKKGVSFGVGLFDLEGDTITPDLKIMV